jgi:hypothetical protein
LPQPRRVRMGEGAWAVPKPDARHFRDGSQTGDAGEM